jgi:dienelactone hydrolase
MVFRSCFGCLLSLALLCAGSGVAVAALTPIHFPSLDDNGPGQPSTVLDGYLFRSAGDAKHPAIVFLHGCSGLSGGLSLNPGEMTWANELNSLGYVVLMLDSFAPRGLTDTCSPRARDSDRWLDLLGKRGKDAQGALRYLQAQSFVQPDRIGVIGWSQGGGIVLMLLNTNSTQVGAEAPRASFQAAVAFYPVLCGDKEQSAGWLSNGATPFAAGVERYLDSSSTMQDLRRRRRRARFQDRDADLSQRVSRL